MDGVVLPEVKPEPVQREKKHIIANSTEGKKLKRLYQKLKQIEIIKEKKAGGAILKDHQVCHKVFCIVFQLPQVLIKVFIAINTYSIKDNN